MCVRERERGREKIEESVKYVLFFDSNEQSKQQLLISNIKSYPEIVHLLNCAQGNL